MWTHLSTVEIGVQVVSLAQAARVKYMGLGAKKQQKFALLVPET